MYRSMNIKSLTVAVSALVLSTSANAVLIESLGGLAYYDSDADLTWLTDAKAAGATMNWADAKDWAANLEVAGVSGWRLPTTIQPDASCDSQFTGISLGFNCTGSEMGNLFYNVLGGSENTSIGSLHNNNYDLFSNIQNIYWSSMEYSPSASHAWGFRFNTSGGGEQIRVHELGTLHSWAVQSGNVGGVEVPAVPVPAAVWLFGTGLLGLIGVAKRKKA